MKPSAKQIGGDHYKQFPIQPSLYCYRNGLNFLAANIVKYATRAGHKGGHEGLRTDIEKIIHYAELWLEFEGLQARAPEAIVSTEGVIDAEAKPHRFMLYPCSGTF